MEDIKPKLSKKDKEFLEGNFWIVRLGFKERGGVV